MEKRTQSQHPSIRPIRSIRTLFVAVLALGWTLSLAGCSSTQPVSTQVDDSAIAAKIEGKLVADPQVNPFKIDVDVNEGVVRLSGTVEKEEVRAEAEKLARDTDGVLRVRNEIEIGKRGLGERISDGTITTKIKAKLTADPQINPFNINVDTKDGVVTLTGRVKTSVARSEAEKLAHDTAGVREVRNEIEVGDRTDDTAR